MVIFEKLKEYQIKLKQIRDDKKKEADSKNSFQRDNKTISFTICKKFGAGKIIKKFIDLQKNIETNSPNIKVIKLSGSESE